MDEKQLTPLFHARTTRSTERTWRCPDDAGLAAYADRQLDERARQKMEAHLAGCDFCLGQVAFLLRFQDAGAPPEVPPALLARARELAGKEPARAFQPAYRWGAVAAATACFALAVAIWVRHPESPAIPYSHPPVPRAEAPPAPPTVATVPSGPERAPDRQAPPSGVRNGQIKQPLPEAIFPQPDSVVPSGKVEFRWKEVPHSLFYEVRLVTAEGDLVWEGRADRPYLRLPEDVHLQPGEKYFVWIRAYLPEGKTVQSRAIVFRVANKS